MAVLSREVAVRRKPLEWRPGPPTPYPLLPATRRFEWLAFVATPIGGILTVVDKGAAGGICVLLTMIGVVIYAVPIGIRELIHRLPERASLSVQYAIGSLYALFFLAVAGLVAYAATEAFLVIVGAAVVFWAIPWFRRRGRAA